MIAGLDEPIRIRNGVVISGGGFEPLVHDVRVVNLLTGVLFPKLTYSSAMATSASAISPRRRQWRRTRRKSTAARARLRLRKCARCWFEAQFFETLLRFRSQLYGQHTH